MKNLSKQHKDLKIGEDLTETTDVSLMIERKL